MNGTRKTATFTLACALACALAHLPALADQPRTIMWDALVPDGWIAPPPPAYDPFFDDDPTAPPAAQAHADAPIVAELDGAHVRLPGYIVPLELDGQLLLEFLMVPYLGACIHVPPPPANQVVHVTLDEPLELTSIYEPFWVTGVLSARRVDSQLATAGYTMRAERIDKYTY